MTPSEVSKTDSVCRFIPKDEWDEDRDEPMPSVFKASNRQLSVFHQTKITDAGDSLRDLCFGRLDGAGEAHFQVAKYLELAQGISPKFEPNVCWRPDAVEKEWSQWDYAHAHVEATGGDKDFPRTYRCLLAQNADCLPPQ